LTVKSLTGSGCAALVKLHALMRQCERATERRNDLVHGIWAREWDGEPVVLRSDYSAGPPPSVDELVALGASLKALTDEINHARLRGFLREALEEKET
jgi:hypothetical protein